MSTSNVNPSLAQRGHEPNTVEVHDYGRFPSTLLHTDDGDVDIKLISPNGRIYSVRLKGNRLYVSVPDGSVFVRPKADNAVEIINLTPWERDIEEAMQ